MYGWAAICIAGWKSIALQQRQVDPLKTPAQLFPNLKEPYGEISSSLDLFIDGLRKQLKEADSMVKNRTI